MSNTQLNALLSLESENVQNEILVINSEARNQALQAALLIPLVVGVLGLANSFRMVKLPDPKPSGENEEMLVG